jgi:hypothetical protein
MGNGVRRRQGQRGAAGTELLALLAAVALIGSVAFAAVGGGMARSVGAATVAESGTPSVLASQAGAASAVATFGKRLAVIGDVGGHADELARALEGLGANVEKGVLPKGLTVVQVGDLVHKGPDSRGVLDIVGRFLVRDPDAWVQLMGNHEARYLGGPIFRARSSATLDVELVERLQDWAERGWMRMAAAVERADIPEGVLITHAGLTRGLWELLGSPERAADAALLLNRGFHLNPEPILRPGRILDGEASALPVGTVWAEAGVELAGGWMDTRAPFGQVHGHTSFYDYFRGRWRPPEDFAGARILDAEKRHTFVEAGGKWLVGVDPSHGAHAAPRWEPYVLHGGPRVVSRRVGAADVGVSDAMPAPDAVLAEIARMEAP